MSNTTNTALALIDSVVKASFHSAYTAQSNQVTLAQLRVVIGRGARWLDFDVVSVDAQPVVAYTTKPVTAAASATGMMPTSRSAAAAAATTGDPPNVAANTLPLTSVLNEAASAAFNSGTCPNPGDPLFVNLRVKTNDSSVYPTIAAALGNAFGSALHTSRLQPHRTTLASLVGRVVFVLDTMHSAPGFAAQCDDSYSSCAAVKQVRSLAGLLCGTAAFPLTTATVQQGTSFSPVMPVDPGAALATSAELSRTLAATAVSESATKSASLQQNPTSKLIERDTSATRWRCTVPDFAAPHNGDVASLVAHWGIQVAPQCFWKDDDALAAYEGLFQNNGGAAFLALSSAIGATTDGAAAAAAGAA